MVFREKENVFREESRLSTITRADETDVPRLARIRRASKIFFIDSKFIPIKDPETSHPQPVESNLRGLNRRLLFLFLFTTFTLLEPSAPVPTLLYNLFANNSFAVYFRITHVA